MAAGIAAAVASAACSGTERPDGPEKMLDGAKRPTIFVSIPSYRDPECQYTVVDLFRKAKWPENIRVAICWQVDREEDSACFLLDLSEYADRLRIVELHHTKARGPCLARALIQRELFKGEDFYFQLDSHFRMTEHWDEVLLQQLSWCPSEKAILTTYPSSYTLPDDYAPGGPDRARLHPNRHPVIVCAREFGAADGFLRITGKVVRGERLGGSPHEGLFWAAGFAFSRGAVVEEVPYDASLEDLFFGEEQSMAARLWTCGWDFYAPTQVVGYHLWTRKHRPIFRELASDEQRRREEASRAKVRRMIRAPAPRPQQGGGGAAGATESAAGAVASEPTGGGPDEEPGAAFWLGAPRRLEDFEKFCGVSPAKGRISLRARRGGIKADAFVDGDPAAEAMASAGASSSSASGAGEGGAGASGFGVPILGLMPSNVAAAIQALAGVPAADPAPGASGTGGAPSRAAPAGPPPKLLGSASGEGAASRLRLLTLEDADSISRRGVAIIDGFLASRGYGDLASGPGEASASDAPRIVRAGAERVPLRAARLGRGDRIWSSVAVRGDEMTWLSAPQDAPSCAGVLQQRAKERVLRGWQLASPSSAPKAPRAAGTAGATAAASGADAAAAAVVAASAVEFETLGAKLRGAFGAFIGEEGSGGQLAPSGPGAAGAAGEPAGGEGEGEGDGSAEGADAQYYEDLDVFLAKMVELRQELDEVFSFGSVRMSAMLARYPGKGAHYARHLDASLGAPGEQRRLTAVYYLNPDWRPEDGGCLRTFFPAEVGPQVEGALLANSNGDLALEGRYMLDIEPRMDRLVLFASGWLEHEVLPSHSERYAITTWLY